MSSSHDSQPQASTASEPTGSNLTFLTHDDDLAIRCRGCIAQRRLAVLSDLASRARAIGDSAALFQLQSRIAEFEKRLARPRKVIGETAVCRGFKSYYGASWTRVIAAYSASNRFKVRILPNDGKVDLDRLRKAIRRQMPSD